MYLYVHIPFCASHCIYCDFYVVLDKYREKFGGQSAYLNALKKELKERVAPIKNTTPLPPPLKTIFFGGGTPSLLPADFYADFLIFVDQHIGIEPHAEITLEANPNVQNINNQHFEAEAYLEAGINRLSIGIQSFQNNELKKLSRIHTADEAKTFIKTCQQAGFDNISIDLMYALPEQTPESWQDTLRQAIDLNIEHISLYGLKVEEQTPFEKLSKLPPYKLPDEDTNAEMYQTANDVLHAAGFYRYEFSNFAKVDTEWDYRSQHNLCYWNNDEFMALGVSAHGYLNHSRYENVRDLKTYLESPLTGENHLITPQEALENTIIFGLRKTEGINIDELEQEYDINFKEKYGHILSKFEAEQFFQFNDGQLSLTQKAIPVSNAILCEFLTE